MFGTRKIKQKIKSFAENAEGFFLCPLIFIFRAIFYALASRQVHKKSPTKKMSSFFSQTFFLP